MALTLYEASKQVSGEVKRSAVIEMFAANSDIMRALPWEDIPGGSFSYNREGQLPGVGFRGFNEGYAESTGIINTETEVLRIAGGDIDVDKALIKTRGQGVRSSQEEMKIKAIALNITSKIINGDSEANPREFDGLRKRIVGEQLISAGTSNPTDGGDALSIELLNDAIDQVDGANALIMSKKMRNRLSTACRQGLGGEYHIEKDEFGNRIAFFDDLPILIADYDNEGKRIMDFNEVGAGGATASATSVYVCNFGGNALTGLQNGILDVEDLGEVDDKPVLRTRLEWLVGLAAQHGRCAARVWGIANKPVVA